MLVHQPQILPNLEVTYITILCKFRQNCVEIMIKYAVNLQGIFCANNGYCLESRWRTQWLFQKSDTTAGPRLLAGFRLPPDNGIYRGKQLNAVADPGGSGGPGPPPLLKLVKKMMAATWGRKFHELLRPPRTNFWIRYWDVSIWQNSQLPANWKWLSTLCCYL